MVGRFKQLYTFDNVITASKLIYDDGELLIQGFNRIGSLIVELMFMGVLTVRISDEGVRLRLIEKLGKDNSLVLVDLESQLLSWVFEEGLHARDIRQAKHFIVLMGEEVYDIVSFSDLRILAGLTSDGKGGVRCVEDF